MYHRQTILHQDALQECTRTCQLMPVLSVGYLRLPITFAAWFAVHSLVEFIITLSVCASSTIPRKTWCHGLSHHDMWGLHGLQAAGRKRCLRILGSRSWSYLAIDWLAFLSLGGAASCLLLDSSRMLTCLWQTLNHFPTTKTPKDI